MRQILIDIQERLQTTVPTLRYVDEDWGQLEYEQPPVQYPCALIDIDGFDFSQTGGLAQIGEGFIYIRIADIRLNNTSANAPAGQKQAAFALFDVLKAVHQSLHGYSGGDYSKLIRTALKRVRRTDTTREYRFVFKTSYTEQGQEQHTTAKPNIKLHSIQ